LTFNYLIYSLFAIYVYSFYYKIYISKIIKLLVLTMDFTLTDSSLGLNFFYIWLNMEKGLILITFIVTEEDSKFESKRLTNILLSCTQVRTFISTFLSHQHLLRLKRHSPS